MLDSASRRQRQLRLLDLYGPLLTAYQRHVLHLAWEEDWSYGEIAERERVSRTAIYDLVRRGRQALDRYERRLRLERQRAGRARLVATVRARLGVLQREVDTLARRLDRFG